MCPVGTAAAGRHGGTVVSLWRTRWHGGMVVSLWRTRCHGGMVVSQCRTRWNGNAPGGASGGTVMHQVAYQVAHQVARRHMCVMLVADNTVGWYGRWQGGMVS